MKEFHARQSEMKGPIKCSRHAHEFTVTRCVNLCVWRSDVDTSLGPLVFGNLKDQESALDFVGNIGTTSLLAVLGRFSLSAQ